MAQLRAKAAMASEHEGKARLMTRVEGGDIGGGRKGGVACSCAGNLRQETHLRS